jgi:hypothetical protein
MIAVTGMHRSGTSCFTGLLARCGFSLGSAYPLLNESRMDNEKGHFENLGAVAINETILRCSGGSWLSPPSTERLAASGRRFSGHMKQFSTTFDGAVFKDPRMCLTIASWEKYCSQYLQFVVLCLRHPAGVALSLQKRDNMEIAAGLELWLKYNQSLLDGISKTPLIVADYDQLGFEFPGELKRLLTALGVRMSKKKICRRTETFYSEELNHAQVEEIAAIDLPVEIASLYQALRSRVSVSADRKQSRKSLRNSLAKFLQRLA